VIITKCITHSLRYISDFDRHPDASSLVGIRPQRDQMVSFKKTVLMRPCWVTSTMLIAAAIYALSGCLPLGEVHQSS